MSARPTPVNKNFGLSEAEFKRLQDALKQGNQQLFEQIFLSHFERCRSLLVVKYGARQNDAYDVVMWSLVQFRHLLLAGKVAYGNLEAYFMRIAVSKYLRDQNSGKEIPTETLPEELDFPTHYLEDEETLAVLAKAWSKLGDICRKLLQGFYYDKLDLRSITALIGDSSEANTRQRKVRCIKELRKLFFELE
ncbi:MAG: hypothetical protein SH848_15450 [Saprospiraceae bacterium]|mgnify:CR=1 FL=1|nr:hypothetical protein [Saprospiraceae bacterium]MDZ4705320.1 hypothetical protein [Saprospiraceae bacterium]